MKLRDGLLLASVMLIAAMLAALVMLPSHLAAIACWTAAGLSGLAIGGYLLLAFNARRRREAFFRTEKPISPARQTGAPSDGFGGDGGSS